MDFARQRHAMVERHIRARGVVDERVLAAMTRVPREALIPPALAEFAYCDTPLPIAAGQTISQPRGIRAPSRVMADPARHVKEHAACSTSSAQCLRRAPP